MYLKMLKGKIHRAVVKQAELNYVGSITVDPELMQAAGILEYENVQIVDIENGNRFETRQRYDLFKWSGSQAGIGWRSYHYYGLCADDARGSEKLPAPGCIC